MTSKSLLVIAAILEAVTGLALIFQPAIVVRSLLGGNIPGAGPALGQIAGIGLFSLGVACWPRTAATFSAIRGMLTYNLLVTFYFLYLRFATDLGGRLLLPATALHGVLAILFAIKLSKHQHPVPSGPPR